MAPVGLGDLTGQSFDLYEGIRIIIPGATAVGIGQGISSTISTGDTLLVDSPLGVAFLVVVAGFLLRLVDLPSTSAVYRTGQPEDLIASWASESNRAKRGNPPSTRVLRRHVFYLMDVELPPNIRSRSLYQGSIFRIGFEAILMSALSSIGVWLFVVSEGGDEPTDTSNGVPLGLVALCALVVGRAFASVRRMKQGRGSTLAACVAVANEAVKALGVLLTIGFATTVAIAWNAPRFGAHEEEVVIASVVIQTLCWVLLFVRGRRRNGQLHFLDPLTSLLLFSFPAATALYYAKFRTDMSIPQSDESLWLGVMILAPILIAARGHERVLRGSYYEVRHWMQLNEYQLRIDIEGLP